MTSLEITTSQVLTLTKVVAAIGGVEEDLDVEDKAGEADAVVEE